MVTPALTTVRVDRYESGIRAMERMLEMIAAPDAAYPPILTPAGQLVVRDSA